MPLSTATGTVVRFTTHEGEPGTCLDPDVPLSPISPL